MTRRDCDVLIIGAGAAGGVLAATLSEQSSLDIVLVEKGGYFGAEFFNQRELDMRVLYAKRNERSTADGAIVVRGGECVGGGTTVNYALCLNPVRRVWDGWKRDVGLEGFSFDERASDYGIPGLNLTRALTEVRHRINVHSASDEEVNDNNRIFERGCRALGITTKRFELNMDRCLECGFCGQGCAYDRKMGTMITYIADALERGVQLIHHCDIDHLIFRSTAGTPTVVGARGRVRPTRQGSRPNSVSPGAIEIGAKVVIVCSGAIESPVLLFRSGHPDPHMVIGKGLVLHPSLPIIGIMDDVITNYRGIDSTVYSDHFLESHHILFLGIFGHPVFGSAILPGFGVEHFNTMRAYTRSAAFGASVFDSVDLANRVEWVPAQGKSFIHYRLGDGDRERFRFAAEKGVEILFAAGAREVLLPSEEPIGPLPAPRFRDARQARYCRELRFAPHLTTITSAHCQATVKMGEDRRRSVVNSRGESHAVRNLLVCDSSVFPTSCGASPMLSVMTMARYQGTRLVAERARYGL
ncbi:MAG: GMC family oxidoreductase N-terminal domain-containing protein [Gemmatimonadetes bacterium]|nr:GMC family oxidoreductase N-terminal domain-containing protein [Gemmatimonadota bacterium]